jgi:hypothetical protein
MPTLIVAALCMTVVISGMGFYVKFHPPEESVEASRKLQRGLHIGSATSLGVLFLFTLMHFHPPVGPGLSLPLILCALGGNIANLMAVIDCLREVSGEGLFAACLLLLNQSLWLLYAIAVMFSDF